MFVDLQYVEFMAVHKLKLQRRFVNCITQIFSMIFPMLTVMFVDL